MKFLPEFDPTQSKQIQFTTEESNPRPSLVYSSSIKIYSRFFRRLFAEVAVYGVPKTC